MVAGVKKTHEEFVAEMAVKHPNLKITGVYVRDKDKVEFECKVCGHKNSISASVLLQKGSCSKCTSIRLMKSQEQFEAEVYLANPNVKVISEYKGLKHQVRLRCSIDGHEWNLRAQGAINGNGCRICELRRRSKHPDVFAEQLKTLLPQLEQITAYKNHKTRVTVRCPTHDYVWSPDPRDLLKGKGCPFCAKSGFDRAKPAVLYLYHFADYIGFGITNVMKKRHQAHLRSFRKAGVKSDILGVFYSNYGEDVFQCEKMMRNELKITDSGICGFRKECVLAMDIDDVFSIICRYNLLEISLDKAKKM